MDMLELYVRVDWPEFQELEECDGFSENSCFCAGENCYFVRKEWLER